VFIKGNRKISYLTFDIFSFVPAFSNDLLVSKLNIAITSDILRMAVIKYAIHQNQLISYSKKCLLLAVFEKYFSISTVAEASLAANFDFHLSEESDNKDDDNNCMLQMGRVEYYRKLLIPPKLPKKSTENQLLFSLLRHKFGLSEDAFLKLIVENSSTPFRRGS